MATINLDQLFTTTFRRVRGPMTDNLSTQNVVLASIREAGGLRVEDGGVEIQENLLYGSNSTVRAYSGYEPFDLTPQEGIDAAIFQWKQLVGTVSISGIQEFKNSGKSRIKSLLETKIKQLDVSFREAVGDQLLDDGTGNGGKNLTGLDLVVEDGTAWSTVGGIDSNTYTFWRNQFIDFDSAFSTSFTTKASGQVDVEGIRAFRRMYNLLVRGTDKPNLILTSREVAEAYESVGSGDRSRIMLGTSPKLLELGFTNLFYKDVPIVWTANIGVGSTNDQDVWFLNTEYLKFVIGSGHNFAMSDFVKPIDQDARVAHMHIYANLTCSNRSLQGRLIDVVD